MKEREKCGVGRVEYKSIYQRASGRKERGKGRRSWQQGASWTTFNRNTTTLATEFILTALFRPLLFDAELCHENLAI